MRIAFFLQTHKCLDQIERLVRILQSTSNDHIIVIAHDGPAAAIERLSKIEGVTRVTAAIGGRGRFGLIDDLLANLGWIRGNGLDYDWLVMMSGQDYLVRPLAELEQKLATSKFDGYYHHFRADIPDEATSGAMQWPVRESQDRYYYAYKVISSNISRLGQILLKLPKDVINLSRTFRLSSSYGLMLGRRVAHAPFSEQFKLVGGSNWLTIRRSCAEYLVDFASKNPDIERHYRRTLVPEESFMQSILYNSGQFNITGEELRYYDFSHSKHGRPKIIQPDDIPDLLRSKYFIARKFDMDLCPDILDRVDQAMENGLAPDPPAGARDFSRV
ncbi:beta-1,6-N-acetylglucosaminyltransferase [Bosea sp. PAMC 26642]|uniref:beta-1,6-N-acetylglucosaminyltransferase n=1 Tax=Bosea sp. (strain PAMC 26642) TaxID=1792307 RepID=UPI0007706822|nr:beta-1,6-N-acetylglucosaminyltransferase [Bosea sp. PAMC 26642]AMJ61951.1 hypothetical protein AXW83_18085 [Bosea sp. PAMC 26642]